MSKTKSIYQTLNEREKYILEILGIEEEELIPRNYFDICNYIKKRTKRISELPVTKEQVFSAYSNYYETKDDIFKGIDFLMSDKDYPDTKVNVFKILSKEDRKVLKILGIPVENKEISSKEYLLIGNTICDKLLLNYGTGVKQKECYKLQKKLGNRLLEQLKEEIKIS